METIIVRCFNQIFRPKIKCLVDGWGDRTTCTPEEKNFKCKGYEPFRLKRWIIEVADTQLETENITQRISA